MLHQQLQRLHCCWLCQECDKETNTRYHLTVKHSVCLHLFTIFSLVVTLTFDFWPHFAQSCRTTNSKFKNAVLENVFSDLDIRSHDIQNQISLCPDYGKYLCKFGLNHFTVSQVKTFTSFSSHNWLTWPLNQWPLTSEPMTFSMSPVSSVLASEVTSFINISPCTQEIERWTQAQMHSHTHRQQAQKHNAFNSYGGRRHKNSYGKRPVFWDVEIDSLCLCCFKATSSSVWPLTQSALSLTHCA